MQITAELLAGLGVDIEELRANIVDGAIEFVADKIYEDLQDYIKGEARKKIDTVLESKVNEWVTELLQKPFYQIDKWGNEKSKEPTTIQKVIEDQALTFMQEKVGGDGKPSDYGGGRVERYLWAARQVASEALEKELRPHIDKLVTQMKADVRDGMAKVVGELVAYKFGK